MRKNQQFYPQFIGHHTMIIRTARRLKELKEYYFSIKLKEVRALQQAGHDVINLGIGSPDLSPSPETIQALVQSANQPQNHGYQPYNGIAALRKAMAEWVGRTYGVSLNPDTEILPLIGSKEGITHISLAFLDEGDEVLVPELGYPSYTSVTEMVGAKVRLYPLQEDNNWEPDWDAMAGQDYSKVKLMWVNYPHMPTGARANKDLFEKIIAFGRSNNILICHDNPYSLILNEGQPLSLLSIEGAKDVCIELNSMSKSHNMAGWRVGWVSGAKAYIDAIMTIKSNVDSGMFLPLQEAAVVALNNPLSWHEAQNDIYRERRKLVFAIMDSLQCDYKSDQTGMFVWAKLPAFIPSAEAFVDHLLRQHHVFITPGFIFGQKGGRYIRISLCSKAERIAAALERVKSVNLSEVAL